MPRIEAFSGVRYSEDAGEPGDLLAPPYDVIDAGEARELRARSPFNAVRLVLPEGEAPGCYELAARRLRVWLRDGLLVRDDEPALYVYGQTFRHGGRELTRHGIFCALRLSPFPEAEVLPHEETHREPKEDRMALMRACRAQLSPVFLVTPDGANRLPALVDRAVRGTPLLDARTPDGLRHRLWRVLEGPLAEELREVAGGRPLLIADGHHRYETALEMARGTPEEHPARRTLACVVGSTDPGLLCLPTHRALSRPPGEADQRHATDAARGGRGPGTHATGRTRDGWRSFLEEGFEVRELEGADPSDAADAAADAGGGAMAVVRRGRAGALLLRARTGPGGEAPAPVAFDRRVLRPGYGLDPDPAAERGLLTYHRRPGDALRAAGSEGAAFLLPPPDVASVWASARRGERLPPKSTYFWPKLPSGVLFRLFDR